MPSTGRSGPAWQTLFNNTYPNFGHKRRRGVRDTNAAHQDRVEPPRAPPQVDEAPAQNVEAPAENIVPIAQIAPEIAARAPSPEPAVGQNNPEAVQQPAPRGRARHRNIPRAEQRPAQDDIPQGRRPRDNNRPEARPRPRPQPEFVRRPHNRPEARVEPVIVRRPNGRGHGQARRRREGPRQQRWARDIENSQGRGNNRSDARVVPRIQPIAVDLELADAFFDTASTASGIDDTRESVTGDTVDDALQLAATNARRNEGPLLNNPDGDIINDEPRAPNRGRNGDGRHAHEPRNVHRDRADHRGHDRNGRHVRQPGIGHHDRAEGLRGILRRR